MPTRKHYTLWTNPPSNWLRPSYSITPEVLKKVEQTLAKPETSKQKEKLAKRLRPFQRNSVIWCTGKGYLRQ